MLYFFLGRGEFNFKMAFPGKQKKEYLRSLLILAAVCSLTLSLATRFSLAHTPPAHGVKSADSRSGEPKRQNLDRDNIRFAYPVESCTFAQPVEFFQAVSPIETPRSSNELADSLYNRPPPAPAIFL